MHCQKVEDGINPLITCLAGKPKALGEGQVHTCQLPVVSSDTDARGKSEHTFLSMSLAPIIVFWCWL